MMIQTKLNFSKKPKGTKKRKDPPAAASEEDCGASPPAAASAATGAPGGTPSGGVVVTPPVQLASSSSLSPYEARMKRLEEYRVSAGDDDEYHLWNDTEILEVIPDARLGALMGEDGDVCFAEADLEDDECRALRHRLTQEDVDTHGTAFLARSKLVTLFEKFTTEILYADPRNARDDGFLMLNTHSSNCMHPVIQKHIAKAQRVLNESTKMVRIQTINHCNNNNNTNTSSTGGSGNSSNNHSSSSSTSSAGLKGVARDAFDTTLAAVLACDGVEHWRLDVESYEPCDRIAKQISKLLRQVLWFTDEELGIPDPLSRRGLLSRLSKLASDWKRIEDLKEGVSYAIPGNNLGMGRSPGAPLPPARATTKRPRTTTTAPRQWANHHLAACVLDYLEALGDKLTLRTRAHVQLCVTDGSNKSCRLVCSGATNLKKLGQLVAFVTGHADDFEYHSQRGKSLRGSYLELSLNQSAGSSTTTSRLWMGDKAVEKKAKKEGVGFAVDKPIKLVQVFQGLIVSKDEGMVYDSEQSQNASLAWISDQGDRYSVTVEGIMAARGLTRIPMPRVVHEDCENPRIQTGFGRAVRTTNRLLRGDRAAPKFFLLSAAESKTMDVEATAKPFCSPDGKLNYSDFIAEELMRSSNIESVGPPQTFSS